MIDTEEMKPSSQPSPDEITEVNGSEPCPQSENGEVKETQSVSEESSQTSAEEKEDKDVKNDKKVKKELSEYKDKCAALEKSLSEQQEKYLRLVAEYDNFRRRSQKEKEGIYADAYTDALKAILPVADNLELAVKYSEGEKVVEGVRMTLNQLDEALKKMGVEVIETETFDPILHNAVMHVEDDQYGENVIVEVFQKGYRKGDKVIRHAMVKVAN